MKDVLGIKHFLGDLVRLLTFRTRTEEFEGYTRTHPFWGLLLTWAAGYGRTWDDLSADPLRRSGLGSVAYVFVLSLLLWAFVRPFAVRESKYMNFLTFVTMVSPLAFIYAIPVERFTDASTAASINAIFLGIVATWRVSLLIFYCHRGLGVTFGRTLLAVFTPLSGIVAALGGLSIVYNVFSMMGGVRTQQDALSEVLAGMGCFSIVLCPILVWLYFRETKSP